MVFFCYIEILYDSINGGGTTATVVRRFFFFSFEGKKSGLVCYFATVWRERTAIITIDINKPPFMETHENLLLKNVVEAPAPVLTGFGGVFS